MPNTMTEVLCGMPPRELVAAVAASQGKRWDMQDATTVCPIPLSGTDRTELFVGVYDGHGADDRVAVTLRDQLVVAYDEGRAWGFSRQIALRRAFAELEARCAGEDDSGSTATAIVCGGVDRAACAWVGDSEAVLLSRPPGGTAWGYSRLTWVHRPGLDLDERARVEGAGGKVVYGYVWTPAGHGLQVSRAFGDAGLRDVGVCAEPDTTRFRVPTDDWALLVATDGLWDALELPAVAAVAAGAGDSQALADRLVAAALGAGGTDNVSVVVVAPEGVTL